MFCLIDATTIKLMLAEVTTEGWQSGMAGPPITGSAYERVPPALPPTWRDALDAFKAAKILPRYFGEEYCLLYHAVKQGEMAAYLARPTALEYAWYLRTD